MQEPDLFDLLAPWLLATLVFVALVGAGRTLRGRWLGRPPFGAGLALSAALGVAFFSFDLLVLGHLGLVRSPWPQLMLALAVLMALPGLFWTWRDYRQPAPGLERGFGLGWFTGASWLLLLAAVLLSAFWITGGFDFEPRGFLFERVGVDYEVGRIAFDPELPRDPFYGDEPLDLWLYGLGSAEAGFALAWWLAVALLFGVCGLGWRLHAHGAGLVAATFLAIVLFSTDRPLFLAPALPATLALMAVMILAVEARGRPNVSHSLVAGLLGGFALTSDLGAGAMLLPLLFFGPLWCKGADREELAHALDGHDANGGGDADGAAETFGDGRGVARFVDGGDGGEVDPDEAASPGSYDRFALDDDYDDFVKFGDEDKGEGGKWRTPLRHTAVGAVGLSLPLLPWLARNDLWADDPLYGFRDDFRAGLSLRYEPDWDLRLGYAYDRDDLAPPDETPRGFEPGTDAEHEGFDLRAGVGYAIEPRDLDLKIDYRFLSHDDDAGNAPDEPGPSASTWELFGDGYRGATGWGLGLGVLSGLGLYYGSDRRRRQRLLYTAPAFVGFGLGAWAGDFETTHPASLGLLSVTAGSTFYTLRGCGPTGRNTLFGGTLAVGGLAVGLSGAYDCGYWDEWADAIDAEGWKPTVGYEFQFSHEWDLDRYYTPPEPREPDPGLRLDYDIKESLDLRLRYDTGDEGGEVDPEEAAPSVPKDELRVTPGYEIPDVPQEDAEETPDSEPKVPSKRPRVPGYQPKIQPDVQKNAPSYPRTAPGYRRP